MDKNDLVVRGEITNQDGDTIDADVIILNAQEGTVFTKALDAQNAIISRGYLGVDGLTDLQQTQINGLLTCESDVVMEQELDVPLINTKGIQKVSTIQNEPQYESYFDGSISQILPVDDGSITISASALYFDTNQADVYRQPIIEFAKVPQLKYGLYPSENSQEFATTKFVNNKVSALSDRITELEQYFNDELSTISNTSSNQFFDITNVFPTLGNETF